MKKLEVRLVQQPGLERVVGQLAEAGPRPASRQIYFEHDPAFLRDSLWLSPFKLPPEPGLIEHRDHAFGPIFGLFDDSLPDGWGLLLMDRFFEQQGLALAEVSVLDRLAHLGTRTMGALTYHPPAEPADRPARRLDLHVMASASQEVIQGTAREVLPQLLRAGGSPAGARPKVLVGVSGEEILSGEDDLPRGIPIGSSSSRPGRMLRTSGRQSSPIRSWRGTQGSSCRPPGSSRRPRGIGFSGSNDSIVRETTVSTCIRSAI